MSFLEVKNIKFKYPDSDYYAVDDVSFVIEKGSYTAIVGFNGSGKSTLARIIAGLELPSSGSVSYPENAKIGLVFQHPKNQIVSERVSADTAFGPQNLGLDKGEVELRTIECLNIVDLLEKAEAASTALSLGQTQKLALSGMLALWPEILILDESVSMLDPDCRSQIFEFLKYWNKQGNTIIHITHDKQAIDEVSNVVYMENGKVLFYGTKDGFYKNRELSLKIFGRELEKNPRKNDLFKEKVISFEDAAFSYDEKNSITDVNFSLYKGTLTALTGPSGAGKSTIMEMGSGLLKLKSGKIYCNSRPLYAQQNADAALFEAFACDDVAFGPSNKGVKGKALKTLVIDSMDKAGLPFDVFSNRHTQGLSGGEKRRLALAGIIAMEGEVYFFDEPTAGLDLQSKEIVMQMMRNLADEGKTVLFSTHKRDEADFADREIGVRNGKIISDTFEDKTENAEKSEIKEMEIYEAVNMLEGLDSVKKLFASDEKDKERFIYKIPPFIRLLAFLVLFVFSLCTESLWLCAAALVLSFVYSQIAGLKIKALSKTVAKIFPFLVIFALLQLVFHAPLENEIRFTSWKWFTITPSKLIFCLASFLRTISSLTCICAVLVSTPEYDLISGLKLLLKPLSLIHVPVRYFILIVEIIFRFIPILVDEAASIIKTQIIRGGMKETKGVFNKIKAVVPLIVPLLIQTIKKSESLADAITMRCFK